MSSDHEAIRTTLARYCQLCDDGCFDEWGELFTEGSTFHVMGRVYEGREAIKAFISGAQPPDLRGKHVTANTLIELDGDKATALTDYVFVGRQGEGLGVVSAGRYHDSLVNVGDRWLFEERRIVFLGEEPLGGS